ncbi:hypothetical protein [Marinobacterium jannaschii]|uniref:hypothetical protein n=1 Tax=Marinobacterium jannaschii TaxID=64970 RepID=UPI0006888B11|nr:hypothetical protein [Marinobacterium jannaschii]
MNSCIDEIQKAAGRELGLDELTEIVESAQRRIKELRIAEVPDLEKAVLDYVDGVEQELVAAAQIEKRNAALNLKRRLETMDHLGAKFADNYEAGIESILVGTNRATAGARLSVAATQNQLLGHYTGGFIADIEALGHEHWKLFISGDIDDDIARALWRLDDDQPDFSKLLPQAVDIARVVNKWQEVTRLDANKAGAWIKKQKGYITRQTHDMYKIREAGYQAWREHIATRLDERTFDHVDDREAFLESVYQGLASGVHLKAGAMPGLKGISNIGKRMSHDRTLHFKDAEAWAEYNRAFGVGSLRETLLAGFNSAAQNTGLMRILGPNAEKNFDDLTAELSQKIEDPAARQAFSRATSDAGWLKRTRYRAIDGSMNIPGNEILAKAGAVTRAIQSMSKLGGAVLSSVTDIPIYASELRYQGRSMLGGMAEATAGLAKGRGSAEQRQILGSLGVVMDGLTGSMTERFSGLDNASGWASRWLQTFFKWNGMTWWTDTMRSSVALGMSNHLAVASSKDWGGLNPELQRVLSTYGLDQGKWEILRKGAVREADGNPYLTPEAVREVADAYLAPYLKAQGKKVNSASLSALREEIENNLRTYFVDRAQHAVIEPDQRTRAILLRGTNPGTVEGEFLRAIAQFKSFPTAVIQKTLGRELSTGGMEGAVGIANVIVWTTMFGYGAMALKDMAKGKEPRNPDDPKVWMAAMAQGGGLGIYGDFLFGDMKNRYGGDALSTLMGPTAGVASDLIDIMQRMRDGDDTAAKAFSMLKNNTPFINLFYTRWALDYLILHRMTEALSPGALRRAERRLKKENDQQFMIPPSTVTPRGGFRPELKAFWREVSS